MAGRQKPRKGAGTAPGELMSVGDVGKMAGVPSNTVSHWIARDIGFPAPVDTTTAAKMYKKSAVKAWLKRTGR